MMSLSYTLLISMLSFITSSLSAEFSQENINEIKLHSQNTAVNSQEHHDTLEEIPETGLLLILDLLHQNDRAHLSQVSKTMYNKVRTTQFFLEKPLKIDLNKIHNVHLQNMNAPYRHLEICNLDTAIQLKMIVQKFPNLLTLTLKSGLISDLTQLYLLRQLQELHLLWLNNLINLKPLQSLATLHVLSLNMLSNLHDITPVQALTQLQKVSVGHSPRLTSLASFLKVASLQELVFIAPSNFSQNQVIEEICKQNPHFRVFVSTTNDIG